MNNRLLLVDLTTGSIEHSTIPESYLREYVGGSGLGVRMLWDWLNPSIAPLDPESPLLFITGPLTGASGPATGRFTVCGRSPQTGWWGEANIGGFVGPELRHAGFDAILITGKAPSPVYLWVNQGNVQVRDASHLWGKTDIYETQNQIRLELEEPRARIACIGLAAENGVVFSGIFSDHGRAAARTGLGLLMASKNLKALAVRGTQKLPIAFPEQFAAQRIKINKELANHNMTAVFRATGTSGAAEYLQMLGDMPQKYWTEAKFESADKISGAQMAETILVGTAACQGCVISCGRVVSIPEGPYQTETRTKGPEYETICSFGSQLLVDDLAAITALGEKCDRLGMDSISAGSVIGLAYLMFDQGIISQKDTDGLSLQWGDPQPAFILLEKIAHREGIGAWMAQGSRTFAARFGAEQLAVQVNGLDVAMHDPRAFSGQTLSYLTSPRGACHNQSDFFTVELGGTMEEIGIPMTDRFTDAGKARFVARHQHWRSVCNSLVMCFFASVSPHDVVDLLNSATGQEWTLESLMKAGERIWNLKRLYNLALGYSPEGEKLPALLLKALPEGGQAGFIPDVQTLRREYYEACGWNLTSGMPEEHVLRELHLEFAMEKLPLKEE
ncbi:MULTISPECIES: aldehyde ferredoxin oxidoreductase family protein [Anaerolinea]|uniref:aldehyde ferredoxin oxidoreductase family protein n=1 Tax=Anaerolinea TaxID=233189 RepID=UPI00262E19A1|nr:aldehyde ferredoxin oxidoreductase family protein [Anaerolinea thermophila]